MVSISFYDLYLSPHAEGPKPEISKPIHIWNDSLPVFVYVFVLQLLLISLWVYNISNVCLTLNIILVRKNIPFSFDD